MAATLRKLYVKRTVYSKIRKPWILKAYLLGCVRYGSKYILFKNPNITTAFYQEGTNLAKAIQDAVDKLTDAPNKANKLAVKNVMARAVLWLHSYADKVEVISNDDNNRNTREEAGGNILFSYLTPQKLSAKSAGRPQTPIMRGKSLGNQKIRIRIVNKKGYSPRKTNFVAIQSSCQATVKIVNFMLSIDMKFPGHIAFHSMDGKGRYTDFEGLYGYPGYDIYSYSQNGKKQLSKLSAKLFVKM